MSHRHCISVAHLRDLLSDLRDDDVLVPNTVGNLMILRGDVYIGYIGLLDGHQKIEREHADE